ncbi:MAG: hypothetical protein R3E66_22210 [bacterium]
MVILAIVAYFFMMAVPLAFVAAFLGMLKKDGAAALPASDIYRMPTDGSLLE